jgi:hypothetical protein
MGSEKSQPVSVSRRISAPAGTIFELLADPGSHPKVDGSGMLREGATNPVISGVGDVFVTRMHTDAQGDYEMANEVFEYELNRRIGWAPGLRAAANPANFLVPIGTRPGHRWSFELTPDGPHATIVTEIYDCSDALDIVRVAVDNGNEWIETMTTTLQLLDELCAGAGRVRGSPTAD